MKKKVRKPRYTEVDMVCAEIIGTTVTVSLHGRNGLLYSEECRKLAAWLIKAADYLEEGE
jgi:hypothetical protein